LPVLAGHHPQPVDERAVEREQERVEEPWLELLEGLRGRRIT